MPDQCRLCHQPILWLRSAVTGNLMAIDAESSEQGNVSIVAGLAHVHRGSLFDEMIEGPKYREHAATCAGLTKNKRKGPS